MLRTVYLEGEIGAIFGREWRLNVSTPREAMHALCCTVKGFRQYLNEMKRSGQGFGFVLDDRPVTEVVEFDGPTSAKIITFYPGELGGAGKERKGSIVQIIVGIILIIVGVLTYNPGLIGSGIGMIAGGIVGLLTPIPKYKSKDDDVKSTTIGGVTNTTRQGLPVPLVYGTMIVGSQVLSLGTKNITTYTPANFFGAYGGSLTPYYAARGSDPSLSYDDWMNLQRHDGGWPYPGEEDGRYYMTPSGTNGSWWVEDDGQLVDWNNQGFTDPTNGLYFNDDNE